MKTIIVKRHGERLKIEAPEGKVMAINDASLAQGILSIGEYGPSGVKIAAFADWSEVIFDCEEHGYTLTEMDPF